MPPKPEIIRYLLSGVITISSGDFSNPQTTDRLSPELQLLTSENGPMYDRKIKSTEIISNAKITEIE